MWFGDLVTMAWWDDLWLNESFASWMGNKATDQLYPEWNMWTQFLFQDTSGGLQLDGLKNSHPIEARVKDPAEIRELFDSISYNKGAAILWMLEQFLGPETFRKGLQNYLSAHKYGNACTEDLWKALDDASGQPVISLMDSWVKQTGFPIIHVNVEREGTSVQMNLSQERFLYDHLLGADKDPTLWQVPIKVRRAGSEEVDSFLMQAREVTRSLGPGTSAIRDEWIKVNTGQAGFYRVNYPPDGWIQLRSAVESLALPPTDRLGLESDAYALMRAGFISAELFLEIVEVYGGETDATVWGNLSADLRGFETLIADERYLDQFYAYAGELYRGVVERVGWDARPGEGHLDALLRSTVLGRSGSYGEAEVIQEAQSRFQRYLKEPDSLHPDLRGVVFGLVAQEGDRSTYDTLWDLEKQATLHEEKMRLLGALARPKRKELLEETLERSLSQDVRSQDSVLVISVVSANRHGRDLAWEFIKDSWAELDRRYGKGGFMIMRLVATTGAFTSLDKADEVETFFRTHPVPSAQRTVQQSLESIRLNAKWLERNRGELTERFVSRG